MGKKVRKCPKCGDEYSAWRTSCLTCRVMLQEVEKKEQTETEKEILREVEEDLPRHWVRKYLLKTVPVALVFILIGVVVTIVEDEWVHHPLLVCSVIGMFAALFAALLYADATPLRKYKLIREIPPAIRAAIRTITKKGPPPF